MRVERESAEREIEEAERPKKIAKNALSIGASAIGIGSLGIGKDMIKRLLPFLNQSLPEEIAVKGISKINGKFGKFIEEGIKKGLPASGAIDYLRREAADTPLGKELKAYREQLAKDSPALQKFKKELGGEEHFLRGRKGEMEQLEAKRVMQERSQADKLERQKIQGSKQGQIEQQQGSGQAALMQILQQINKALG